MSFEFSVVFNSENPVYITRIRRWMDSELKQLLFDSIASQIDVELSDVVELLRSKEL